MTGFATQRVMHRGRVWVWDLRSVNGRGLELKLRLPDAIEGLESLVRPMISGALHRGNVQVSLRRAGAEAGDAVPAPDTLNRVFRQIAAIEAAALRAGVTLAPVTAADVLAGSLVPREEHEPADQELVAALRDGLAQGLAALAAMRAAEGKALTRVLSTLIGRIETLVQEARKIEKDRGRARAEALHAAMAKVMGQRAEMDAGRLEQELALLAVRADVAEELDRLEAHVTAARTLVSEGGVVGRKLDFLTQEFNREANTLCAKAQFPALTRVGLDLKAAIDQVREQVQNVE